MWIHFSQSYLLKLCRKWYEAFLHRLKCLLHLHFIQCACRFTDTCSSCRPDGTSASKRMEIKQLISELKKVNPFVEGNIFKSVENVNLQTVIAYKQDGVKHHFLDTYDGK